MDLGSISAFFTTISSWFLPALLFFTVGLAVLKGVPLMDAFIEGAWQGIRAMGRMLPLLIMMVSASSMLEVSGLLEALSSLLSPLATKLNIPAELLPLALMKPLSGAGTIALLQGTLAAYGPDSVLGRAASTIMGASDTAVYLGAMYLSSADVKRGRYALPISLVASFIGTLAAIVLTRYL